MNFPRFSLNVYLFFSRRKQFSGFIFESGKPTTWGPPVGLSVARRWLLIGCPGRPSYSYSRTRYRSPRRRPALSARCHLLHSVIQHHAIASASVTSRLSPFSPPPRAGLACRLKPSQSATVFRREATAHHHFFFVGEHCCRRRWVT
jgi:hypothetical protein